MFLFREFDYPDPDDNKYSFEEKEDDYGPSFSTSVLSPMAARQPHHIRRGSLQTPAKAKSMTASPLEVSTRRPSIDPRLIPELSLQPELKPRKEDTPKTRNRSASLSVPDAASKGAVLNHRSKDSKLSNSSSSVPDPTKKPDSKVKFGDSPNPLSPVVSSQQAPLKSILKPSSKSGSSSSTSSRSMECGSEPISPRLSPSISEPRSILKASSASSVTRPLLMPEKKSALSLSTPTLLKPPSSPQAQRRPSVSKSDPKSLLNMSSNNLLLVLELDEAESLTKKLSREERRKLRADHEKLREQYQDANGRKRSSST